jgi:hypothetical protein
MTYEEIKAIWYAAADADVVAASALRDAAKEQPELVAKLLYNLLPHVLDEAMEPSLKERFDHTEFLVEADQYAISRLWREYAKPDNVSWEDLWYGYTIVVGKIAGFPINVSFTWCRLNNHLIAFYECVSRVSDYNQIEGWLDLHCNPTWDNGRLARCNAANFHLCLEYCLGK